MASAINDPVFSMGQSKLLNSIGLTTATPSWSYGGSTLIHAVQADAGAGGGGSTGGGWSRGTRLPWGGNTDGWSGVGPWDA